MQHLITGMELNASTLKQLLMQAQSCKQNPDAYANVLKGKALALLFEKPSFRTRLSFIRAMQRLGGEVLESVSSSRKSETPADLMRVLNTYVDAVMIRTHEEAALFEMAEVACIPIINGLSAMYHPCQALADFAALEDLRGDLSGFKLAYVGDRNNVLRSLQIFAPLLGVEISYASPGECLPVDAVVGADAVYTDVWSSMGFEQADEKRFVGFQVNETLMKHANPDALFMHCMPMERGKEVSMTLPDAPCSIIFLQSEYRLYVQMAVLMALV